jgi:hypothetical protein
VDIAFAPAAVGAQSGTLNVTSTQIEAGAVASLSGMGFDFQATYSGNSSQTVSSGQTATYQLSLVNLSPSSAAFSIECGALPSYAACVLNPASANVPANGTGSATLQITTSRASSAARLLPTGSWPSLAPLLAVIVLPFACRARRRLLLLLPALVIVPLSGLTACSSSGGGGGGTPPANPVAHTTPAGTYTIPVTISSTGVQHTVTLTLIVD